MHREDIRAALKKLGFSPTSIGVELDVSEKSVRQTINGVSRSKRIEERISEITDIPLYRLWPQWHAAPEGVPKDFDPFKLNLDLLESVERNLAAQLMRRVPTLRPPLQIRGELRVDVYNACLARGTAAIETGAGTADEVEKYLDAWALSYEKLVRYAPDEEAWCRWALIDSSLKATATPAPAATHTTHTVTASHGSTAVGRVSGSAKVRVSPGKV